MEIENVMIKTEYFEDSSIVGEEDSVEIKSDFDGAEDDIELINDKPYKCGICGHRTTTDTLLKVHMKMHIVKRLHQCNICQKTFNFVTELNTHIITHTEQKSGFQCQYCNRDCFTEEDLQKHCRTHTKEKPIQCKLCHRSFSDHSYLRVHERSHHGEDYLKKNMMLDGTFVDPSLVQNINEENTSKVDNQKIKEQKMFKNNPNTPLNNEEKLFLLQYVEQMGLNCKYAQMEQLKTDIKSCWVKMAKLFEKKDYDRNSDKLARTYFQMRNQAKTNIHRFHKNGKPVPDKLNWMFVTLCPGDYAVPGVDVPKLQKISQQHRASLSVQQENVTDEYENDSLFSEYRSHDDLNGSIFINSEKIAPQKRPHLEEDDHNSKVQKISNTNECPSNDINVLKMKLLLAEEQRKNHLYKIELKEKEDLFTMEKVHREEMYRKEIEIKDMEIQLMKKKLEDIYKKT